MIKVTNLHKSFGELAVLKGIDFQADTGEVIVIIGLSGMGKSTFSRCINYIERAMAVNPKLILLDEPTSSLDPELVLGILDILRNLANEHKRTMIIVTHEMSFAKEIADRIIFMDDGRIIEEGTPEEIFSNPQNERTKRFLERFQTF